MTKQGRADFRGPADQKIEPRSEGISPGAVSYIGIKVGNHSSECGDISQPNYPNMSLGNGFSPNGPVKGWDGQGPGAGRNVKRSGSQGKY